MMVAKILVVLLFAFLALFAFMMLYEIIIFPIRPGKGEKLEAVLHVSGNAPGIENTLRGLFWMRCSGRVKMEITVLDEGMDEETRRTAELMCMGRVGVHLKTRNISEK